MKKNLVLPILLLSFVWLGCGLTDSLKSVSNANLTVEKSAPPPTASASPTTSPVNLTGADSFKDQKNLLAFASGTVFVQKPSEYYQGGAGNWTAIALIDDISSYGWAKKIEGAAGETMVLEMAERSLLKTLVFDTKDTDKNAAAKNITVEISDTSATEGFQEVLATALKNETDNQIFNLTREVPGRWLRLTIKDNYGSPEYTEIMEMRGYGKQLSKTPLQDVSGTYKMEQYGPMHIKQDGTSVSGCYEYAQGLIEGGVEDRVMRLKWTEGNDGDRRGGPALMAFSQDGKKLIGAYGRDGNKSYAAVWNGEKISDEVGNCPHAPNLSSSNAAKDIIGKQLKEMGRAAVYGINFDFDSDVIRAESKPTLDQITALLKENADWKMTIEGHTDNVGGVSYNQTLSEKRAAAVKKHLIDAGIVSERLTSAGFGFSKPVAANDGEFGRAQNRRVELVKQ